MPPFAPAFEPPSQHFSCLALAKDFIVATIDLWLAFTERRQMSNECFLGSLVVYNIALDFSIEAGNGLGLSQRRDRDINLGFIRRDMHSVIDFDHTSSFLVAGLATLSSCQQSLVFLTY